MQPETQRRQKRDALSGRDGPSPSRRLGNLEAWRTFNRDRLKDANVVVGSPLSA
jgi:hypothetical protein